MRFTIPLAAAALALTGCGADAPEPTPTPTVTTEAPQEPTVAPEPTSTPDPVAEADQALNDAAGRVPMDTSALSPATLEQFGLRSGEYVPKGPLMCHADHCVEPKVIMQALEWDIMQSFQDLEAEL